MQPLDLHKLSWNDFVANGVFWILDVALISILVPFLVRRFDKKKWASARRRIAEQAAEYLDRVNSSFELVASTTSSSLTYLPQAAARDPKWWTEDGLAKLREAVFNDYKEAVQGLEKHLEKANDTFLQELQLLAPAFTAELANRIIDFHRATVPPTSYALAFFNLWILQAAGGTLPTAKSVEANYKSAHHEEQYRAADLALERLCEAGGLQIKRAVDGRPLIEMLLPQGSRRLYPNHPMITSSFQTAQKLLVSPIARPEGSEA